MMAFILAIDFDFIAYMSKMAFFFLEAFFTPMAFLEYDFHCCLAPGGSSFCTMSAVVIASTNSEATTVWRARAGSQETGPPLQTFQGHSESRLAMV